MSRLRVKNQNISGEIIDNELIIIDLVTGSYFNSTGAGPLLWRAVELGVDAQDAISLLSLKSPDPEGFTAAARSWLDRLVRDGILTPDGESADIEEFKREQAAISTVVEPTLEKHDDLEDLLLYDPVHDVNELGWPKKA